VVCPPTVIFLARCALALVARWSPVDGCRSNSLDVSYCYVCLHYSMIRAMLFIIGEPSSFFKGSPLKTTSSKRGVGDIHQVFQAQALAAPDLSLVALLDRVGHQELPADAVARLSVMAWMRSAECRERGLSVITTTGVDVRVGAPAQVFQAGLIVHDHPSIGGVRSSENFRIMFSGRVAPAPSPRPMVSRSIPRPPR